MPPTKVTTSANFKPAKNGKQKHLACADTVDPSDVVDRVEYQVSEDDGKTWRTIAFVTNAKAAPPLDDPTGPMQKPGVVVRLDLKRTGTIFRTIVTDSTGKALKAISKEMV